MSYTDWTPHLDYIPNKSDINILEFGIGYGTLELVKHFKKVYSIEILDQSEWFDKIKVELSETKNWDGRFIEAKNIIKQHEIYAKNFDAQERKTEELSELLESTKSEINYNDFQMFFVDAGVYFRGEIVNFLFQFNPTYIMVHDTNGMGAYGYTLCNNEKYKFTNIHVGEGTGLFIKQ